MDFLKHLAGRIVADLASHQLDRGLAAHANRESKDGQPPTSVHVGWISRVLGLICCALVVPIALALVWAVANNTTMEGMWFTLPFFNGIAIWLSLSCWDSFVRRIEWTETHVHFRRLGKDFTVPWSDILGLEEKDHPPHVRIVLRDGTGFGIHQTMNNSRYFMRMIERRLGPDAPQGKRRKQRLRKKKR